MIPPINIHINSKILKQSNYLTSSIISNPNFLNTDTFEKSENSISNNTKIQLDYIPIVAKQKN